MSKYWFRTDEDRKFVKPFKHIPEENAKCYRLENNNIKYKQEVLDDSRALSNIHSYLSNMLRSCRTTGEITLDEEDCLFLCKVANKKVELYFDGVEE